jgi:hypothetical protein
VCTPISELTLFASAYGFWGRLVGGSIECAPESAPFCSSVFRFIILDQRKSILYFPNQLFNDCNQPFVGYAVSNAQIALKIALQLLPLVHPNLPLETAVFRLNHRRSHRFRRLAFSMEL